MTIGEIKKALDIYPDDAILVVAVSIPDLFVAAPANLSIVGNRTNPKECDRLQFLATVPSRYAEKRTVQEG